MSSAFPEVGLDTSMCREMFQSPSCLHVRIRFPSGHPGLSPSNCDLCVLLQMALNRAPQGCHSAH